MSGNAHGLGGLKYDPKKRHRPPELNVFYALLFIVALFEVLGRVFIGDSFLFNTRDKVDTLFNEPRLKIIILQVAIIGIIALGVTQVIISGGIDLSSGSIVGSTAMIATMFAQSSVNQYGMENLKPILGTSFLDLPVVVPVLIGLLAGAVAGLINGVLIAYAKIPPFIATLGMMLFARGVANWTTKGKPVSYLQEGFTDIGSGMTPVFIFIGLALVMHFLLKYTRYGKHTYAIGSNEQAARMSGIHVERLKVLVYTIAGILSAVAAVVMSAKALTGQSGMGLMYELDAIAMAVIGGVSLAGGRGSILGTCLGALIYGCIISGFTFLKLDAFYQEMAKGAIIVGAVVLDQWRARKQTAKA
jgi:inositol transport system permease protein